ncbi:hypothetical protein C4K03_4621 [Pseudomonas synxantha]|uniref:Uncharacterized protein n=1 Tax=Pseudomonas synxantha TaxID=47883 RepID=A0A3G7UDT1_9PSED|nr:hypothetical protein C4K03_4621 [Pseudomonas synxantha]
MIPLGWRCRPLQGNHVYVRRLAESLARACYRVHSKAHAMGWRVGSAVSFPS